MSVVLKMIQYREFNGQPLEWTLSGLVLGPINLLVGKNATGKTRSLNIIKNLAGTLRTDSLKVENTDYDVTFDDGGKPLRYVLRADSGKVVEEKVWHDGDLKLQRTSDKLSLKYEKVDDGKFIDHEPSPQEISAVTRRDKHQHPFLLPLRTWADGVRHYSFGANMGRETVALQVKAQVSVEPDDMDQDRAVHIFLTGRKHYGDKFVNSLLDDMRALGYPLQEISADSSGDYKIEIRHGSNVIPPAGELRAFGIREEGIPGVYFQHTISQGMFRALSVLTQVTYSQMASRAHCIIIDDIGEGLDYDRAALLIDMLRKKAKESKFQLIMATNDQFVMNHVPLDEWSILQRRGGTVVVKNSKNSPKVFEDFKFVGLSNFAFFEMDFANAESEAAKQLTLEDGSHDE